MLVIFKHTAEVIIYRPLAKGFLLCDMLLTLTDTEKSEACRSDKDIAV